MAVAQTSVIDITGGIFTALGLVFAGITIGLQRGKILSAYRLEIAKGRVNLDLAVNEKLKSYVHQIKQRIDTNFAAFDTMLEEESIKLDELAEKQKKVHHTLIDLKESLSSRL
jgi:hypothetical protein